MIMALTLTRGSDSYSVSGAAIARAFGAGAAKFWARDDFNAVGRGAPPALDLNYFFSQHRGFFDHRGSGDINVPELTNFGRPHHIKAGQVATVGTAKA